MLETQLWSDLKMKVPKIRGTVLGVPIIRIIVYWGLHWGPLILGNYQMHPGYCLGCRPYGLGCRLYRLRV